MDERRSTSKISRSNSGTSIAPVPRQSAAPSRLIISVLTPMFFAPQMKNPAVAGLRVIRGLVSVLAGDHQAFVAKFQLRFDSLGALDAAGVEHRVDLFDRQLFAISNGFGQATLGEQRH